MVGEAGGIGRPIAQPPGRLWIRAPKARTVRTDKSHTGRGRGLTHDECLQPRTWEAVREEDGEAAGIAGVFVRDRSTIREPRGLARDHASMSLVATRPWPART